MKWIFEQVGQMPKMKNPLFIEGLPGIGNVGKVAVDFIIEESGAKLFYRIRSDTFPNSVFVNENNLVDLPKIEIYYKKTKKEELLFLTGDLQPVDEVSSYDFCDRILEICKKAGCKRIITLGGIGLQQAPKDPKVFCTGNSKAYISTFVNGTDVKTDIYGVVGNIIGVSGLLLALPDEKEIKAITLLAETFGHPMYLGVKGAREILKILDKKLSLKLDMRKLEKEIKGLEQDLMKRTQGLVQISKRSRLKKIQQDIDYIG